MEPFSLLYTPLPRHPPRMVCKIDRQIPNFPAIDNQKNVDRRRVLGAHLPVARAQSTVTPVPRVRFWNWRLLTHWSHPFRGEGEEAGADCASSLVPSSAVPATRARMQFLPNSSFRNVIDYRFRRLGRLNHPDTLFPVRRLT